MTEKDFYKIFNINISEKPKKPIKLIFKDGRDVVLSYYQSIAWEAKDRDVSMIIDNTTGEILYMAG